MSEPTGSALALPNESAALSNETSPDSNMPAETSQRLPDGRFAVGNPGNPQGRPRGSRNRATLAAQALLNTEAEALTQKIIEAAKGGDAMALRFCMERLVPRRTTQPINMTLAPVNTQNDVLAAHSVLIEALAEGEIEPAQAKSVALMLDLKRQSIESIDFERRLSAAEDCMNEAIAAVRAVP